MRHTHHITVAVASLLLFISLLGCTEREGEIERCPGTSIAPHVTPVNFGELAVGDDGDYQDPQQTPYQWTLLLHSQCDEEVHIDEACLIGNDGSAPEQFFMEGPEPEVASLAEDAVVRLTYDRQTTHGDGEQDDYALVVQSNAEDHPTLVVPICARTSDDPDFEAALECNSPVAIPAEGERVDGLCS